MSDQQRLYRWLVTISKPKKMNDDEFLAKCSFSSIRTLFTTLGKKWVFQLERGDEKGNLHYQGFISLHKKSTKKSLLKEFNNVFNTDICKCVTVIQSRDEEKSVDYCSKDNRVSGPWTSEDVQYTGRDLDVFNQGYLPWQKEVYGAVEKFILTGSSDFQNNRQITLFLDPKGRAGKTVLVKKLLLDFKEVGYLSLGTVSQMSATICLQSTEKSVWVMDLSRTMIDNSVENPYVSLFNLLESLKDGLVHSQMYGRPKLSIFGNPMVLLFTNEDFRLHENIQLSQDRWHIYNVQSGQLSNINKVTQQELYGISSGSVEGPCE